MGKRRNEGKEKERGRDGERPGGGRGERDKDVAVTAVLKIIVAFDFLPFGMNFFLKWYGHAFQAEFTIIGNCQIMK